MKIKLEFQYFDNCPNHKKMRENLINAIKGLEDQTELKEVQVDDETKAKVVKFRGSPTLLINGNDFEGMPEPSVPSLSCRFYPMGIPTVEKIREKIIKELGKNLNN